MSYRISIIGGGNMGGAIVRGCIDARIFNPEEIIVAEIESERRAAFSKLGCATTAEPASAASADTIVLALKPQVFVQAAQSIAPIDVPKIVISIMAGLNSQAIRHALGEKARIVRAMPNTPCQIGAGMTAIALGHGAQSGDEKLALAIFNALGRTLIVDESLMYAVTAVSGSGPAYIYLLAEAMEEAAIKLGIDQPTAQMLVNQTVMGAGKLLNDSAHTATELRQAVTSPGGTTAAALDVFESRQFKEMVIDALTAARDRGQQLDRT